MLIELFEALLVSAIEPLALPLAVGANFTWNVRLCPAAIVAGRVKPLMLKTVPLTVTLETVTLAVLAVRVTFCVLLLPVFTDPKLTEVGEAARVPTVAAPVPLSGMLIALFEALLVRAMEPLALPLAVGANLTWNVTLCPAPIVAGRDKPLMLKPTPLTVALEIVTLAVLAVRVTFCELLLPTVTDPKLTDVGEAARVPTGAVAVPLN
jgi:hypothetical protein